MKRVNIILGFVLISTISGFVLGDFAFRDYILLIPILFSIQILLNDFIEVYLFKNMGSGLFKILIAPGTIIHELSHLIVAKMVGCRIIKFSLFHFDSKSGNLGFVEYSQPIDRFSVIRCFVVGLAPFFGCGIALISILNFVGNYHPSLGLINANAINLNGIESILSISVLMIQKFYQQIQIIDLTNPIILLILYLEMCLALGSAPSIKDFSGSFELMKKRPFDTIILVFLIVAFIVIWGYGSLVGGYGEITSGFVSVVFKWIILILLISISFLIISIPLVYVLVNISKVHSFYKIVPFLGFFIVYYIMGVVRFEEFSLISSSIAFISLLIVCRYPGIFIKS